VSGSRFCATILPGIAGGVNRTGGEIAAKAAGASNKMGNNALDIFMIT
jgi:hypothetical protein